MKVDKAIKWIEWAEDVYYVCTPRQETPDRFMEEGKQVKELLKSLEAKNETYQRMWNDFKDIDGHVAFQLKTVKQIMEDYEKVYLGGNENENR